MRPANREPDAAETAAPPRKPGRRTRFLLHAAWVALLAIGTELGIGRFGFHPSDQGFILAQSWRLLHGEIPHSDAISARPLASALLHGIDFLIPAPLFAASGALSMLEIILGTIALTALVTRRPVLTWGPGLTLLVAAAALINLNSFPLMAWHTVDGIMLTACGAWALDAGLRSGRAWPRRTGLFLFGVAVFVKQSFALAAVLGALWLLLHPATREGALRTARWWRRTVADLLWLGAFPLAYVAVVALDGGFGPMVDQLTGGLPAYGEKLLTYWLAQPPTRSLLVFTAAVAMLVVARVWREKLGVAGLLADRLGLFAAVAVVGWTVVNGRFVGATHWADLLWWALAAAILANGLVRRRVPWPSLLVLALGFMISLSWGQDTPTLLAGSLALTTTLLLIDGVSPAGIERRASVQRVGTIAVGLVAILLAGVLMGVRHGQSNYLDLGRDKLTKDLGEVTPTMRGIRTNPSTFRYIEQIRDCTRRFPAEKVAVLPDNPFAYPAFQLRNPFPLEWPLLLEVVADAPQRMIGTAEALNRQGSYLVLFQTVRPETLAAGEPIPAQVNADTPIVDYLGIENGIKATLTGETVTCGSFVGKWAR
ncbi:hypothetical protein [Amycolatopsis anabasis]|uniref:hypothetical protein n=1 Tax=Amycolatopsis anabasis TaxID=1840409 RepID=UPI001FE49C1E|nr:hypothetical protein [Amycolatopsis anabasis]